MLFLFDFIALCFITERPIELVVLKLFAASFQLNLMLQRQIIVLRGNLIEFKF